MSYRIRPNHPDTGSEIRRIALAEIDSALALADDPALPPAQKIHDLRKHGKKLRALIRIVRPVFVQFDAENAALREAGHSLSALRDRESMLEGLEKLLPDPPAEFAPLRARLAQPPDATAVMTGLALFRAQLHALRDRVPQWQITESGFAALSGGILRTHKRARRDMLASIPEPSADNIHNWRKRIKDLWYFNRLLVALHPEKLEPRINALGVLAETLGFHHDLSLLLAKADPALAALITARQAKLAAQAQAEGAKLLRKSPHKTCHQLARWWAEQAG